MKNQLVESFSGIRGIYGESLTDEVIEKYARVYADYLRKKNKGKIKVVIGRDTRASGPAIQKIFTRVWLEFGFTIINAGVTSTPAIEFGVRHFRAQGGVIITGSHNPAEFNGLKMLGCNGAILTAKEAEKIIVRVHALGDKKIWPRGSAQIKSKVENKRKEIEAGYTDLVLKILGSNNITKIQKTHFKILADSNGGPASRIIKQLFGKLKVEVVSLNMKEGEFVRDLEPNIKTLKYLVPIINKKKTDFGFGLDCDADRVEIVLGNGHMISGNEMMALGVESVLSAKKPGQKVVTNLPTSHVVHEIAWRFKAKITEVDVGETNVVTKMEELDSPVGGEGSCGGLIIAPTKCRDGLLAIAIILSLLARKHKSLAQVIASYPVYTEERIRAQCEPGADAALKNKLLKYFKSRGFKTKRAPGRAGGIKILYNKYSWLFFRASQTEPGLFRIIANANDKKVLVRMIREGENIFYRLSK